MCGIAGIIGINNAKNAVEEMCNIMVLRGPDKQSVFSDGIVTLGHCRLSIRDLTSGDQPMFSSDNSAVIVFNGEIYNYRELREELIGLGYDFHSTSDTEVVLAGYTMWGIDKTLERMDGMCAFAIYDKSKQKVILARDRFGEKPLFYKIEHGIWSFASELKALQPNLNEYSIDIDALNYFLALSYIPAPHTIYNEIKKIEAGQYVEITLNGMTEKWVKWYKLAEHIPNDSVSDSYEEAQLKIKELLLDSVKKRMDSDVPSGAFLSGGIDSSIITCLMSKISKEPFDTFTIGYEQKEYDERERAQAVINHVHSKSHIHVLKFDDVVSNLDDIIGYYDEPYGDSSAIPSYYVAKLAKDYVKVVLTGDCGDETFGGYNKYLGRYYANKMRQIPRPLKGLLKWTVNHCPENSNTNMLLRKMRKVVSIMGETDFDIYYRLMCLGFRDDMRKELLNDAYYKDIRKRIQKIYDSCPSKHPLVKEQFTDYIVVLEGDMFPKVDKACMHNSLENRAPILDSRIVNYMFSVNPEFKIKGKNKKRVFKDAFKDILPEETLKFGKKGFGMPIDYWLRNELKQELEGLLNHDFLEKQGIFNPIYVQKLLDEHLSKRQNHRAQLWNLYVFQKWYIAHQ